MTENNKSNWRSIYRKRTGYTLTELVVAAAVSSIVVLSAVQLYLSNQQTVRLQNALSNLHENGRFVLRFMRSVLRLAGSRGQWVAVSNNSVKAPPIIWSMTEDGPRFDTLALQYETGPQGGNTCTGSQAKPNTWYFSQYGVVPFGGDASLLQLVCRTGELISPVLTTAEPVRTVGNRETGILVAGADVFQVLFGVRDRVLPPGGPERYVPASAVDHARDEVVTVRIGVLLSNPDYHSIEVARALTLQSRYFMDVLDQQYDVRVLSAEQGMSRELSLRRVFETTVTLRNGGAWGKWP